VSDGTAEEAPKRAWEKGGPSPNPSGRPKCVQAFRAKLAEHSDEMAQFLIDTWRNPSEDMRARLEAVKIAAAYVFGKPSQSLNLTTTERPAPALGPARTWVPQVMEILREAGQLPRTTDAAPERAPEPPEEPVH
jgi:hypothetical protein